MPSDAKNQDTKIEAARQWSIIKRGTVDLLPETPIFTPVQPLSLCDAVTIATQGTSSSNCAK